MDISNICDYCEERHCENCPYGNPCLECINYNTNLQLCMSDIIYNNFTREEDEK